MQRFLAQCASYMRGVVHKRRLLVAGAAFVFIGGLGIAILFAAFNRFSIEGSVRPPLVLRTAEGTALQFSAPYTRRHLLLFFLVSCSHCQTELEHLRQIRPLLGSCDVFAISLSRGPVTKAFAQEHAFPFPVWLMTPEEALVQLGVRRVPTLMFVDEMDYVDRVHTGARSFAEDSVLLTRYCQGGVLRFSAVDSLGEDGSPMDLGVTSGSTAFQREAPRVTTVLPH